MPSHVLILGCGRSGTSIFGELFEHLRGYTYYSEPPFDALSELSFAAAVAIKVPTESRISPPDPGLSFPLGAMLSLLPEPRRIYWQIRHPLDAIASLRVGIANNWGHHPRPLDWKDWLDRPLVDRCAHHWSYLNTVGYSRVKGAATVWRFEDMILDPRAFAQRVCADVAVDTALNASEVAAWCDRVQDTNNDRFIEAKTSRHYSRADHSCRVGRWRENLSRDEVRRAVRIVSQAATTFGYEVPPGR